MVIMIISLNCKQIICNINNGIRQELPALAEVEEAALVYVHLGHELLLHVPRDDVAKPPQQLAHLQRVDLPGALLVVAREGPLDLEGLL